MTHHRLRQSARIAIYEPELPPRWKSAMRRKAILEWLATAAFIAAMMAIWR
jgi:hypothetical protein